MIPKSIILRIGAFLALAVPCPFPFSGVASAQNRLPLPQVQEFKLRNGLTVWLSEDHSRPIIAGNLTVRIGAKDSPSAALSEVAYSALNLSEVNAPAVVLESKSWQLEQHPKSKIYFYHMHRGVALSRCLSPIDIP